jgi:hypothetical protein
MPPTRVHLLLGPEDGLTFEGEHAARFQASPQKGYRIADWPGLYVPWKVKGETLYLRYDAARREGE